MTDAGCAGACRLARAGRLCALLALCLLASRAAAAQAGQQATISPLPASDYAVRPVCAPPAPGYASCLALELVPETAPARAHSHPLGITRSVPIRDGAAAEPCRPPIPAEGCWGLRPQDLHAAYALPTRLESGPTQTIALVDAYDDPTAEKDLKVYDEEFDLPACTRANGCFTKVNAEGKHRPLPEANGEAAVEISLDIEVAHGVCQNCHILLVEAASLKFSDLEAAENRAVTLGATEISNSWYGSEPTSDSAAFDHPGTVITAAAGDYGYLNWGFSGEPAPEEIERGSADYPASSPHVIAVGGTRLTLSKTTDKWESESVWNGYGASGSACSGRFAAPPWQLELPNWASVGCGAERAVADVAADADPYTGVAIYDSTPDGATAPYWRTVGGTSLSSPLIAATFALAGGARGVEYPARSLYEAEAWLPASLHDIGCLEAECQSGARERDIEPGSNGECTKRITSEGLSGCTVAEEAESCSGQAICVAGRGYDGPSGVGTPDGIAAFEGRLAQAITFTSPAPSPATVAGPAYEVAATSSSGLGVSFASATEGVCSVLGSTVSFEGTGTCTIDANQAGDADHYPAPEAEQSFEVRQKAQAIEFSTPAPSPATVASPAYKVAATASSGLTVSLSSATPSVCSVLGSTVSFEGVGTCTIDANQAGDADYEAAPQAQQSFEVDKKAQVIAFLGPAPISATAGGPTYAVLASASSGLAVSLSSATPGVCSVLAATVSFASVGTCMIDANQAGDADYTAGAQVQQSFAVGPAVASALPTAESEALPFISAFTPPLVAAPNSAFSLRHSPSVNRRDGAISFTLSTVDPGTLTWLLSFRGGGAEHRQAHATACSTTRGGLDRACQAVRIVFAKGSRVLAAGRDVSVTIAPSAPAARALARALANRGGLVVVATLTFRSSLLASAGGSASAVAHTYSIADHIEQAGARGKR